MLKKKGGGGVHVFKSISFLLASIRASALYKSFVKIYQTYYKSRISARQRTTKNINRCPGLPTRHPTDLHIVLAAKLCPLNKLHSKADSIHSCSPQIFIYSPKSSFCIHLPFGKLDGQRHQAQLPLRGPHELQLINSLLTLGRVVPIHALSKCFHSMDLSPSLQQQVKLQAIQTMSVILLYCKDTR